MAETFRNLFCIALIMTLPLSGFGMVECKQAEQVTISTIFHNHCDHDHHEENSPNHHEHPESIDSCLECFDSLIIHDFIKPVKVDNFFTRQFRFTFCMSLEPAPGIYLHASDSRTVSRYFHPLSSIIILS